MTLLTKLYTHDLPKLCAVDEKSCCTFLIAMRRWAKTNGIMPVICGPLILKEDGTYEGGYTEEAVALARRYCISAIQPEAIQAEIGEQDLETGPAILGWIQETYMSGRTISEICRDEITALRHSRGRHISMSS